DRCVRYEVPLHTDAAQAVGRLDVNIADLGVDLLSFSAHKIYGPKGVGGLILNSARRNQRLAPQIVGGGQQNNLRSGTLNTTGIIGLAKALEVALQRREVDVANAWALRSRLWQSLSNQIDGLRINGPEWEDSIPNSDCSRKELQKRRLAANLNICFPKVDGQSLMLEAPALAVSSGSACTSANPEASHVLLNIGRNEDEARGSIRFGIGRFNTEIEIDHASEMLIKAYRKLAVFVA
ncbi:MAG: aminotransferase class V-fold PLP-dependent enzyme, partial [Planctomycetes bacterium]|nr:aminotransferase class V-fold PLP-dependent enzyme [Planctomycetota bacterium]